ncbi:MAG: hypothetical protein IPG46_01870 [Actinobacteria bacterium]|nr:hypothetical protein [Actinomycetota bacterium]
MVNECFRDKRRIAGRVGLRKQYPFSHRLLRIARRTWTHSTLGCTDLVSGTVTECYRSDPNGPATPFDEITWLDDAVYFMANQAHGGVERLDVMRWTVESGMQVVREEASNPRVANGRLYVKVRSAVDRERAELVEIDPISGAVIGARLADGVAFYAPTAGGVLWGSHLDRKLHFTDDDGHALDVGDVTLANPTGGDQCVAWQANNALNTGFSGYAWLPTRRRLVELGWLIDARADHEWLAWSALTFNSASQLYEGKEVVLWFDYPGGGARVGRSAPDDRAWPGMALLSAMPERWGVCGFRCRRRPFRSAQRSSKGCTAVGFLRSTAFGLTD